MRQGDLCLPGVLDAYFGCCFAVARSGELKIAEVKSRFAEYSSFIKSMRKMGFDVIHQDDSNKMFVLFDFLKTARKSEVIPVALKPCLYKKR